MRQIDSTSNKLPKSAAPLKCTKIDSTSRKEKCSRRVRFNSIVSSNDYLDETQRSLHGPPGNRFVRRLPYTTVQNIAHNGGCRTQKCTRRLDRRLPRITPSIAMKSTLLYRTEIALHDKIATPQSMAITVQGANCTANTANEALHDVSATQQSTATAVHGAPGTANTVHARQPGRRGCTRRLLAAS